MKKKSLVFIFFLGYCANNIDSMHMVTKKSKNFSSKKSNPVSNIGLDILYNILEENPTKIIAPAGLNAFVIASNTLSSNLFRKKENSLSLTTVLLESTAKVIEIAAILNSDKIASTITIKKITPKIQSPFINYENTVEKSLKKGFDCMIKKTGVPIEDIFVDSVYTTTKRVALAIESGISGYKGLKDLNSFIHSTDNNFSYLLSGLINMGVSAGIFCYTKAFTIFKKHEQLPNNTNNRVLDLNSLFTRYIDRLVKHVIITPKIRLLNSVSLCITSGTTALYGIKYVTEATNEIYKQDPAQNTLKSAGKFIFGMFSIGGAIVTIANLPELTQLTVEKTPKKGPLNKMGIDLLSNINVTLDKYFSSPLSSFDF